jgi:hypothetical protein
MGGKDGDAESLIGYPSKESYAGSHRENFGGAKKESGDTGIEGKVLLT